MEREDCSRNLSRAIAFVDIVFYRIFCSQSFTFFYTASGFVGIGGRSAPDIKCHPRHHDSEKEKPVPIVNIRKQIPKDASGFKVVQHA